MHFDCIIASPNVAGEEKQEKEREGGGRKLERHVSGLWRPVFTNLGITREAS
jgi:hypothetical protein